LNYFTFTVHAFEAIITELTFWVALFDDAFAYALACVFSIHLYDFVVSKLQS